MGKQQVKRIAVVGGGVAGLTAAWALHRESDVTLYESDARLGGHAHSHVIRRPAGGDDVVDTGFIVMNTVTYPTFTYRLLRELGVRTQPAEMSMSVSYAAAASNTPERAVQPVSSPNARPPETPVSTNADRDTALPPCRPKATGDRNRRR